MRKLKLVSVILLLCISAAAFCEEAQEPEVFNNSIGFVYTPSIPIGNGGADFTDELYAGLQFQRWCDKIGFSLTGSMYYDQQYEYGSYASDQIGRKLDWKLLAGAQFVLCTFNVDNLSPAMGNSVLRLYFWLNGGVGARDLDVDLQNVAYIFAGTGIGTEMVLWKHIAIPLEIGYYGQFLNNGGFGISASTGLRFRF